MRVSLFFNKVLISRYWKNNVTFHISSYFLPGRGNPEVMKIGQAVNSLKIVLFESTDSIKINRPGHNIQGGKPNFAG